MDKNTTFGYWLTIAQAARYEMKKHTRPMFVADRKTPETLNEITIGQLIELSEIGDTDESFYKITSIILGMTKEETNKARAVEVVRFVGWVVSEVERINKLFDKIQAKPTAKEQRAGVERLNFGLFGMIDWYARRMGIQNHDEVFNVPWARIYKCMDMDAKTRDYERRLQEIATKEIKRRR